MSEELAVFLHGKVVLSNPPQKCVRPKKCALHACYYENNKFFHDCGIMYIDESKVFYCIMTKDLAMKNATNLIGTMVHNVYSYTVDTKDKLDYYRDLYDFE